MPYKHVSITKLGGPEVLKVITEKALPEPKKGEVRIKVLATSASFTDTLVRKGAYPEVRQKPPITPGYDLVGVIDKLGEQAKRFTVGDKVAQLTIIGAYTEYICLDEKTLAAVPNGLDDAEAVALILTYVTAYQMLHRSAKVKKGDTILIHGAGGAVGTALLQLGKQIELKMYGTGSKSKQETIKQEGGIPIDYNAEDFVEVIQKAENKGITAAFDAIGGDHFKRSLKTLDKKGMLVTYGFYNVGMGKGGNMVLDFFRVKLWDLLPHLPNITFYIISRWHKKHNDWFQADLSALFKLLQAGKIKPVIEKCMKLEDAAEAHKLIDKAAVKGKIVLMVNQEV